MPKENRLNKKPTASRPHGPAYGIDVNDMKGMLKWNWALQRLTKAQNYFLATVRPDGRPHVMPVWGIWIENRFYFSTGRSSVKARNLAKNRNCVLCAGDAGEALVLEGRAAQVRTPSVLKKIARTYLRKYKVDPLGMREPIFSVTPRIAFGQIEKTFVQTATRWTF